MKKNLLTLTAILVVFSSFGQEFTQELKEFNRLVISPKINVVLDKGEHEGVRFVFSGIDKDKINIEQQHKTISLYLDDARIIEKNEHRTHSYGCSIYNGAQITAYVTYKSLKYLEIRGNQQLTCNDTLEAEVFTIKAFGENDIQIAALYTSFLKASFFGENRLEIKHGKAYEQQYRLFGESKINTENLKSQEMAMNIFGESKLKVNAISSLRVTAFGEPEIHVNGGAHIRKRIFGEARISRD